MKVIKFSKKNKTTLAARAICQFLKVQNSATMDELRQYVESSLGIEFKSTRNATSLVKRAIALLRITEVEVQFDPEGGDYRLVGDVGFEMPDEDSPPMTERNKSGAY